ncbi:helix-turn-helix transcriptional regulator [Candidatus Saccharibacteria bacterium]|nr:helix-turn-helix transcriptional regulator [Candidatus Saccharibacteria bacterium]
MKLLGDYWTLRIIDNLSERNSRFCELQRSLDNLNPVTLTDRLKKLEDSGLVNRTEDLEDKVSVTYSLSTLGKKAVPVVSSVNKFSKDLSKAR